MPKLKKALSAFMAVWLCVMLVTFTYTWVSRNWTPSINSNNMSIATAGALLISISGDDVYSEVSLNDIIGIDADSSFVFRQVSSQDGANFYWKDFSPTLTDEPALFYKVDSNDTHKKDYIDTRFCLKLDDSLKDSKYIFIHPETMIKFAEDELADRNVKVENAMRIALTYEKEILVSGVPQLVSETVILGNLEDNEGSVNTKEAAAGNDAYRAVSSGLQSGTVENDPAALAYQPVYGLQYFNCGRAYYDWDNDYTNDYDFIRDPDKALFVLKPGEMKWIDMKIWLEGQDLNCEKEIAGNEFQMVMKFDSVFVDP